eukprot:12931238-Prorocentrum_lima.AAC.1
MSCSTPTCVKGLRNNAICWKEQHGIIGEQIPYEKVVGKDRFNCFDRFIKPVWFGALHEHAVLQGKVYSLSLAKMASPKVT